VRGVEVRDGRFDAWIERDDSRPLGRIGEVEAWRFPSYFTSRSNVDRSSVSSLACGHRVISVGNCEDATERIHRSSSQGPTRDGRYKPEIAAPGSDIVAARGFSSPDRRWVAMTGDEHGEPARCRSGGPHAFARAASHGDSDRRHHAPDRAAFARVGLHVAVRRWLRPNPPPRVSRGGAQAVRTGPRRVAMKLTAFHAADGDCVLLSSSDNPPHHLLVDGGRSASYEKNIRAVLGQLREAGQKLDIVCVSHIDDDHITGILHLVEDEVEWRAFEFLQTVDADAPEPDVARPPEIGEVWHNGLFRLVGDDIAHHVEPVLAMVTTMLAGSPDDRLRDSPPSSTILRRANARRWSCHASQRINSASPSTRRPAGCS
jgi:hypothetical protein